MKRKWILIPLVSIAILFTGGYIYFKLRKSKDFEPLIKAKLASLVSDVSKGLYQLDMEHIEIDITSSYVIAKNILLKPDSTQLAALEKSGELGNDVFTISLKKIELVGLSPVDFIDGKNIHLQLLELDSPEIEVAHKKRTAEKTDSVATISKVGQLEQSFKIDRLLLNNIRLTINDLDKNKKITSFKNLSAYLADIQLDSTVMNDSTRFLFAKDAVIFMKGYSFSPSGKKYNLEVDSVALRPQFGVMQFFDIRLQPIGTKDQFSDKLSKMEDRYDINFKKAEIKNVRWYDLLAENGFYGGAMNISGGYISVYDDRRLPVPESKLGKYPHQLLMKIDFPVYMSSINIKDIKVIYEELNPKTGKVGKLEFDDVKGTIDNISNIPGRFTANPFIDINVTSKFLGEVPLQAKFRFDMNQVNKGVFSVDAELGKINGDMLNQITEPLALVKVNSLEVKKFTAHIDANDNNATGKISFDYSDLNIDILKKKDDGEMKKRGFLTFLANKFVIKKNGPQPAEVKTVHYVRDPQRSFFNLIWKTMLAGIKETVK